MYIQPTTDQEEGKTDSYWFKSEGKILESGMRKLEAG
jgi:hypothetical protein